MSDSEPINKDLVQDNVSFIGLSQLEGGVDVNSLSININQPLFQKIYRDIRPDLHNSQTFIAFFRKGFAKATGIPKDLLHEKEEIIHWSPKQPLFILEEPQYNAPMSYQEIVQERERLLNQLRVLVNLDARFKSLYVVSQQENKIDNEKVFSTTVASTDDKEVLMRKYTQAEELMGEISAYYYVQYKLIQDHLDQVKENKDTEYEMTSKEKEGYKLLKIALAQRWYKSLVNSETPRIYTAMVKQELSPQTDEAFEKLVDHMMNNYGGKVFEAMVRNCSKRIHCLSDTNGIHTDSDSFGLGDTEEAIRIAGQIYPFMRQDLINQYVINIEFLPGNALFWHHMQEIYPATYNTLIKIMHERFEEGYSEKSVPLEVAGVEYETSSMRSLYRLFVEKFPEALKFIPEVNQYIHQPDEWLKLIFRYDYSLINDPPSRKAFLLNGIGISSDIKQEGVKTLY